MYIKQQCGQTDYCLTNRMKMYQNINIYITEFEIKIQCKKPYVYLYRCRIQIISPRDCRNFTENINILQCLKKNITVNLTQASDERKFYYTVGHTAL
jgi:hypothetical protein